MFIVILELIILFLYIGPRYRPPRIIHNVITNEECEYIKEIALPKLSDSTLGDIRAINFAQRKSESSYIHIGEDPKLVDIALRCVKPEHINHCEKLQVVRYKPGGFFKPHHDADATHQNKRKCTFMFALNDEYKGGLTDFPTLSRSYKLRKGDVLHFDTLDTWDRINPKELHGGAPVTKGEKWICTLWVRQSTYDA